MNSAHDAILDFILANPCAGLRELAAETGYTISWLSQVINSDIFQAEYARRRDGLECSIMQPIATRLNAVAQLAIDRIEDLLQTTEDPDTIIDSFDKVMHRTGYAPNSSKSPIAIQNNVTFLINKDDLAQGRAVMQGNVIQLPLKDVSTENS